MVESLHSLKMTTAKSSMTLISGQLISQTLLGLCSVALIRLLLPAEYGLYAIALIPYGLLQPLRDLGMHYSVQHHLSKPEIRQKEMASRLMLFGVLWEISLGAILSIVLLVGAEAISQFLSLPSLTMVLMVSTPSLAGMGVVRVAYGSSIALNRSEGAAGLMILTSGTKLFLSVSFVLLGEGAFGAMAGFGISTVISAIICIAYLCRLTRVWSSTIRIERESDNESSFYRIPSILLRYGSPIGIADLTTLLSSQVILFIAAATITTAEFGVFNSAYILYLYVYSLFAPILLSLLSMFSRIEQKSPMHQMAYQRTTNIASTLAGLIGLAVVISAEAIIGLLFGPEYRTGAIILALLGAVPVIFPPFGSLSSGMILLGSGNPNYYSLSYLIAAFLGVLLGFLTIPQFGIFGILIALYASYSVSTLMLYLMVNHKLRLELNIVRSLAGVVSMIVTLGFGITILQTFQAWNNYVSLILALVAAETIGLTALIRIKILTIDDAALVEDILANIPGLRILGRTLHRFVRIVSR